MARRKKVDADELGLLAAPDDGLGQSLEGHPLFDEIYELLRNRFSPETIVRMLQWQYGDALEKTPLPSSRTIHRWRLKRMPPSDLLPPGLLESKLGEIPVKVDLFQSLQNAYRTAEERLARAVESEAPLQGIPLPVTDKAFETVVRVGELLLKVGQDLGLYPRAGGGAQFGVFLPLDTPPLGQPTDDEITAVVAAVFQKRTGLERPQLAPVIDGEAEVLDG
jgi:hypothetical protein